MSHLNNEIAVQTETLVADVATSVSAPSTKDSGRVKIGGAAIRFASLPSMTRDAGRVKIGGAAIRFSTRDAGRVKFGGAAIRF